LARGKRHEICGKKYGSLPLKSNTLARSAFTKWKARGRVQIKHFAVQLILSDHVSAKFIRVVKRGLGPVLPDDEADLLAWLESPQTVGLFLDRAGERVRDAGRAPHRIPPSRLFPPDPDPLPLWRDGAGGLSAPVTDSEWVITSYLAANTIILPMSGWLAVRLGRRNYFLLSIAVFTVASALCGMATSLTVLIGARVVQGGLAGGGRQPSSQAVLLDAFAREKQGAAMTMFGVAALLAPVIGPTLGGYITDNVGWRWIFIFPECADRPARLGAVQRHGV
jgi:hypothetical protein